MKRPLKIGAYLRVSTDKQVQVFEGSLETQKFRMQEFIKLKNFGDSKWGEIVEFYIEEGYSAGSDRRPQYQRLMSDIRKKKIDLILISDLTRLSRNIEDFCALQRELEKYNAGFFSMKEQFDASTPSGRMMVNLMVSMAQFEREQTAERVAINCHSRAMRGYVNGGKPILGYSRHPERKGVLVINEEEAPIVKMIFDLFLQNGTRAKTITALHEKQIFPKRTVKESSSTNPIKWTPQSLSNALNQASYIGYKEVNKTYKNENPESLKPWQKYQMVKASWPAIIEESKFWEAQRILEEASIKERERLQSGERKTFFLSHLLTCGECGRALVGQSAHGKTGNIHRYYYHSRKFDDHNCQRPRLHAGALEEKLMTDLKAGLAAAGYFNDLEKSIIASQKSQAQISESEVDRLKKEFSEVNNEVSGIWRLQSGVQLGEDSLKMASEQLEALAKRKKALAEQIQEHERIVADKASAKDKVVFVEDNLKDLLRGWAKATNAMKKRLLRRVIKRIVVTKDEMRVVFWLSADERDGSNPEPKASEIESGADILEFRRRSRQAFEKSDRNLSIPGSLIGKIGSQNNIIQLGRRKSSLANAIDKRRAMSSGTVPDSAAEAAGENLKFAVGENQNSWVRSSGNDKFGSEHHPTSEPHYPAVIIELPESETQAINSKFAELYINGYSLRDISMSTGRAKSVIQRSLVSMGIELRPNVATPFFRQKKEVGKSNIRPPYGFCYFQGKVVPDQKEYENLMLIYQLWKLGTNPNRIADTLTEKKIKPRLAKSWNRNSIINILNRFENKQIILKGGHLELR